MSKRYAHPIKPYQLQQLYDRVMYLTFNSADRQMVDVFVEAGDVYAYWDVEPYGYALVSGDFYDVLDALERVMRGRHAVYVELSTHYPGRSYAFVHVVYTNQVLCYFKLSHSRGSHPLVEARCYSPPRHYPYDVAPQMRRMLPEVPSDVFDVFIPQATADVVNDTWNSYVQQASRRAGFTSGVKLLLRRAP